MTSPIVTVHKLDVDGAEKIAYAGRVLERGPNHVVLEARFGRGTMELGYTTFRQGDRFVEWFYADRWYNVFAIHEVADDSFKGWYCNITRPAEIGAADVRAVDLALDLFVAPNGTQTILDEDEFHQLVLSPEDTANARAALAELQRLAEDRAGPFTARRP